VQTKREIWESHFMLPRMQKNVIEWTLTFPSEFTFWELESKWTPEFSKSDFRGQNPLDWGFPYIIGKLIELRCLKWARMTHLDTSNTSYGQKKGWPLKVRNRLDFLRAGGVWHTFEKLSTKATTLLQTSFQSEVCTQSYGPPKSRESQLWEFQDPHLRVPGQNNIWVLVPWPGT
jgi:hypothetical protein